MTAVSLHGLVGKNRLLVQFAAYAAIMVVAVLAVVTSLGILGASLDNLVVSPPRPQAEIKRPNVPLPPVIEPPAAPRWGADSVRGRRVETSFVTLGPRPADTTVLSRPGSTDTHSFETLAPPGQQVTAPTDLTTDVLANPLAPSAPDE